MNGGESIEQFVQVEKECGTTITAPPELGMATIPKPVGLTRTRTRVNG
jgi:hypothetical protein